jgi:hypothetical protein
MELLHKFSSYSFFSVSLENMHVQGTAREDQVCRKACACHWWFPGVSGVSFYLSREALMYKNWNALILMLSFKRIKPTYGLSDDRAHRAALEKKSRLKWQGVVPM